MKTNEELQKDVQDAIKYEPLLHAAEIGDTAKDADINVSVMKCSIPFKILLIIFFVFSTFIIHAQVGGNIIHAQIDEGPEEIYFLKFSHFSKNESKLLHGGMEQGYIYMQCIPAGIVAIRYPIKYAPSEYKITKEIKMIKGLSDFEFLRDFTINRVDASCDEHRNLDD